MMMDVEDYDTDNYYNQDVVPLSGLSSKYADRRRMKKDSFNRGFLDGKVSILKRLEPSPSSTSWAPLMGCCRRTNGFLDGQDRSKRPKHKHHSSRVRISDSDEEGDQTTPSCGFAPKRKRFRVERARESRPSTKKRVLEVPPPISSNPPPELEETIRKLGGTAVKFVMQKKLVLWDTLRGQNRFPISLPKVTFLNADEREKFYAGEENGERHVMMVPFLDTEGKRWELSFRKWKKYFALATTWYKMLANNKLLRGDWVELWSFRVQKELWFALVKVLSLTPTVVDSK